MTKSKIGKGDARMAKESQQDKAEFPRITIEDAVHWLQKIVEDYAGTISYQNLAKMKFGKPITRGGAFGQFVKSFKLLGLLERQGLSELKVTPVGKKIVACKDDQERKMLMYEQFKSVPIFAEMLNWYPDGLPKRRKAIAEKIESEKRLERREAGRLAGVFVRQFEYFIGMPAEGETGSPSKAPEGAKAGDRCSEMPTKKVISFLNEFYALFPRQAADEKGTKDTLRKATGDAASLRLTGLAGYLEGVQAACTSKTDEELKKFLRENAEIAKHLLEKELK